MAEQDDKKSREQRIKELEAALAQSQKDIKSGQETFEAAKGFEARRRKAASRGLTAGSGLINLLEKSAGDIEFGQDFASDLIKKARRRGQEKSGLAETFGKIAPGTTSEEEIASFLNPRLAQEAQRLIKEGRSRLKSGQKSFLTSTKELGGLRADIAGEELSETTDELQQAVGQQLQQALAEAGFQGSEAREQVGEVLAGRGLGRSTIGSQQIGDVTLAEQRQKAQARQGAFDVAERVEQREEQTLEKIEKERERLERVRTFSELTAIEDFNFQVDQQDLQEQFQQDLLQIQLDQRQQNFIGESLGGILGSIGSIFTGGL